MRVFISADIEGTDFTTIWDECDKNGKGYAAAAHQMTMEAKAACEGAISAGADYILLKDAHGSATNMDTTLFPKCVEIARGWTGGPKAMVEGIDDSFDAAMFIGYHSAAGRNGNPLSHTFSGKTYQVKLNGKDCSEFMLYSWCCAQYGVPTVFLSGDKMLTEDSKTLHPMLKTVATKDGMGGFTRCLQPERACELIREGANAALNQDISKALCAIPSHFVLELSYKEHPMAVKFSNYPGFELIDSHTIRMETDDLNDILRCVPFVF